MINRIQKKDQKMIKKQVNFEAQNSIQKKDQKNVKKVHNFVEILVNY